LPAPYRAMASEYLERLEAALKLPPSKKKDARQATALLQLCWDLHAYPAAVQWLGPVRKTFADEDDPEGGSAPWLLLESGNTKEALKAYERKLGEQHVEIWKDYYKKQIQLVHQRATNMNNAAFSAEFVREHYLKGFEEKADCLGSLQELNRALPL